MKMKWILLGATIAGVGLLVGSGCDWSTNGGSLNTSQGAGVNINFSGVYYGNINGRAVDRTSAGTISYLTIRQTGNRIEVIDSQGSRYEGSVGSPGVVSTPDVTGKFPAGAELVQAQISWVGKDGVAQRDVEFVGIIHAVSVQDIKGETTESTRETSDEYRKEITTVVVTNAVGEVVIKEYEASYDGDGNLVFELETTTTIPGSEGDRTTTQRVIVDNRSASQTIENTYRLTEANVQYRLEGTWIEKNSPIVSRVDAISRGTFGIISISTAGSQERAGLPGGGGGGSSSGGSSGGT